MKTQLIRIVARIHRSKNWLLITARHALLIGFHGANRKKELVAENLKMVNLENFLAITTNVYKRDAFI